MTSELYAPFQKPLHFHYESKDGVYTIGHNT
uniref:Uncharacterized protein n=1 Tax=Anguilla anguilla TaxID=7936 RepID=A0A0E9V8D5_ANGAN